MTKKDVKQVIDKIIDMQNSGHFDDYKKNGFINTYKLAITVYSLIKIDNRKVF